VFDRQALVLPNAAYWNADHVCDHPIGTTVTVAKQDNGTIDRWQFLEHLGQRVGVHFVVDLHGQASSKYLL
jgi:hypothetical protein